MDIAYYNSQVREKSKPEGIQRHVRRAVGGDRTNYTGLTKANTAALEVVKCLFNSVLADDAEFRTLDIVDYYLNTPLLRSENMRIKRTQIPDYIMVKYDLDGFLENGVVLWEISKGMYGLPQAGKLAHVRLIEHLKEHDYDQSPNVPCLFRHKTNGITFILVVDDFGVKVNNEEGWQHILTTL